MKILVVDDNRADRTVVCALLTQLGHTPTAVASGIEALTELEKGQHQLMVTDWNMPAMNGVELTGRVRQQHGRYVYVIMVTGRHERADLKTAFSAGIDEFVSKPVDKDELEARVRVGQRIVELEGALRKRVLELESALRRLDVSAAIAGNVVAAHSPGQAPLATPTGEKVLSDWSTLDAPLGRVLSEFLQDKLAVTAAAAVPAECSMGTTIPLYNVDKEVELGIAVAVRPTTLSAMTERVFGEADADAEMQRDLLNELANLTMGGLKSFFLQSGWSFTGGLPKALNNGTLTRFTAGFPTHRCVRLASNDLELYAIVGGRLKQNVKVKGKALREGMVLAKDVCSATGALFAKAGTRLSATTAERLARAVPNELIELADPEG